VTDPDRKRRLFAIGQVVLAVGLLFLVARIVPWSDTLIRRVGDRSASIEGTIDGEWKTDRICFVPEPGTELPPLLASEVDADGAITAARPALDAPSDEPQWDWRPGMPRVFRELDPRGLVICLAALVLGQLIVITRWWRLLAVAGCTTTWWRSFRLTFLGVFFNLVVPGLTGGDVPKAVLAVSDHPKQRTRAFLSVFVDRLLGLFALGFLAAVVILWKGEAFAELRLPVALFLLGGIGGALVYASDPLRRVLHFDAIVKKLPLGGLIEKLDDAVLVYARHPFEILIATLLSLLNHTTVVLGTFMLGRAIGDDMPLVNYFVVVPIANTISALPLGPGGWGAGEAAYGFLFDFVGGSATLGIAVSVTFRLLMMALGLAGGLFLLAPSKGPKWSEVATEGEGPGEPDEAAPAAPHD